jgi:hypothetical protein
MSLKFGPREKKQTIASSFSLSFTGNMLAGKLRILRREKKTLHFVTNARSREVLGTLAFNGKMDDLVHAMSLTKNIPEDHRRIFVASKSID